MGNSFSPGYRFDGIFWRCPFSPQDVLDEIWDLIESVSEGFPTYSCTLSISPGLTFHMYRKANKCKI